MIKKPGFRKTRLTDSDIDDWVHNNVDLLVDREDDSSEDFQEDSSDLLETSSHDPTTTNTNTNTNRSSGTWRREIITRYKHCIVSGVDRIECDAAHIVPFNVCLAESKEEWGNDPANGILLSKNLHWTFDRLLWSLDPNNIQTETETTLSLKIVIRPTKRRLTILGYHSDNDYATIHKDSLSFIKIHFQSFLDNYNSNNSRSNSNRTLDGFFTRNLYSSPSYRVLKTRWTADEQYFYCLEENMAFHTGRWVTFDEGQNLYGNGFIHEVESLLNTHDQKEDPDWNP